MIVLVVSTGTSCLPRVYNFHSRIHGRACCFHRNELFSKSLQLPFPYPWTCLLFPPERAVYQESTATIPVSMDVLVVSTGTSCLPRVYNYHSRIHGRACCFHRNELFSKSLQIPFPYPWTCLLFPLERAVYQESTTSITVSMDVLVVSTGTSCFPRVYNFHSRIHDRACCFHRNELFSKSLQLPFPYPWALLFNPSRGLCPRIVSLRKRVLLIRFLETATCQNIRFRNLRNKLLCMEYIYATEKRN
jgi:hypothetical protein